MKLAPSEESSLIALLDLSYMKGFTGVPFSSAMAEDIRSRLLKARLEETPGRAVFLDCGIQPMFDHALEAARANERDFDLSFQSALDAIDGLITTTKTKGKS